MKVSTVAQMRNLDKIAIERYGIADPLLMENAGLAAFSVIQSEFGVKGRTFAVLCGAGNNGGDGFVVARKIHSNGGTVRVFLFGDKGKFKGAARTNLEILEKLPVKIEPVEKMRAVRTCVLHADALVDALFGTGLVREVEGTFREAVELINGSGKPVFSLDIPSGVNGDTGEVMGVAVEADCTITFGLPKVGNLLYPGYGHCGQLYVTHISFPPALHDGKDLKIEINHTPPLPPRKPHGHKKTFGEALFIAGASSYFGAPYFAALSFMKAGGGYARLAAPRSITPFIAGKGSEIVFAPQEETPAGGLALKNKAALLVLAEQADMVILGPGLSLEDEAQQLARELAGAISRPLILDGDGITALCGHLEILKRRKAPTLLTPHLGEMSRITGLAVAEIDRRKVEALQETAADLGSHVVLKGAHSLVGYPDGRVFINQSGNSGMATAGSGDVLAGTIAAMLGLGLGPGEALRKGVFIHGLAGDLVADDLGEDGITAQDILEYLPLAVKMDREGLDGRFAERYAGARVV